jgi:hypothetical protein
VLANPSHMVMVDFRKDVAIIPAVNEMTDKVVLWGT